MVYGTIRVKNKAFTDKTNSDWLAIDFAPETSFHDPVGLKTIKQKMNLSGSNILKQKRISVVEIMEEEYGEILEFSKEKIRQPLPSLRQAQCNA